MPWTHWKFPAPSSWEMFGALQIPDKGCTLHLIICIRVLSEGCAFEWAAKKCYSRFRPNQSCYSQKDSLSFSRRGGKKVQLFTALSVTKQARPGCGTGRRENYLSPKDSRPFHHWPTLLASTCFSRLLSTQCHEIHCSSWFLVFGVFIFFLADLKTYHYETSCAVEPSSWLPDSLFSFQTLVLPNGQWCLPI